MKRAIILTPTQRQWRRMKRKRQRRVSLPKFGLLVISLVLLMAGAFQVISNYFDPTFLGESRAMPKSLRGGNAWTNAAPEVQAFSSNVTGRVTRVRDGDTIEVSGRPIRFAKLDCAEMGTLDGQRAYRRMRDLVSGQTISCQLTGRKSYDRWIGSCRLPDGRDLSSVMVKNGYCAWWRG